MLIKILFFTLCLLCVPCFFVLKKPVLANYNSGKHKKNAIIGFCAGIYILLIGFCGYLVLFEPVPEESHVQVEQPNVMGDTSADVALTPTTSESIESSDVVNVLGNFESMQNEFSAFIKQYNANATADLYYVCDGKYDIIGTVNGSTDDAEQILKDLTVFLIQNGYRQNVMSITLTAECNKAKSIAVVRDFSSEILPYVGYTLYKGGIVTDTSLVVDKDILF